MTPVESPRLTKLRTTIAEFPNIRDLLKEGQQLMVQVSKGPIGTKGVVQHAPAL